MIAYFFDSSATVKRYSKEIGTNFVTSLFKPSTKNVIYVSEIALAEVVSALSRQKRGKFLNSAQCDKAIKRFRRTFKLRLKKLAVDNLVIEQASLLAEKHYLRGYDAVQLASALEIQKTRNSFGASSLIFISADNTLNQAALNEGLTIDNPNNYP
jgi:uncharacterized protein